MPFWEEATSALCESSFLVEFLWREENRRTRRKLSEQSKNRQQTQPRIPTEPHWWKASAFTTASSGFPNNAIWCCFFEINILMLLLSDNELPLQLFLPSPWKPDLQIQICEPSVVLQVALLWQPWRPVVHSSISRKKRDIAKCYGRRLINIQILFLHENPPTVPLWGKKDRLTFPVCESLRRVCLFVSRFLHASMGANFGGLTPSPHGGFYQDQIKLSTCKRARKKLYHIQLFQIIH